MLHWRFCGAAARSSPIFTAARQRERPARTPTSTSTSTSTARHTSPSRSPPPSSWTCRSSAVGIPDPEDLLRREVPDRSIAPRVPRGGASWSMRSASSACCERPTALSNPCDWSSRRTATAAQHICSNDALTVPRDNGDAITILGNRRVIDSGNAEHMRMAVGFRTASPES